VKSAVLGIGSWVLDGLFAIREFLLYIIAVAI
jgi:hypothetical protein